MQQRYFIVRIAANQVASRITGTVTVDENSSFAEYAATYHTEGIPHGEPVDEEEHSGEASQQQALDVDAIQLAAAFESA